MNRVYNFSAGPSVLPEPVLKKAADEMLDYNNCGMSVMEMSHRSALYKDIIESAEEKLRKLMDIPEDYHVLFLQGGASLQFAMVPMNLIKRTGKADYINTGEWSKKAVTEAKKFGKINVVASSEDKNFSYIPHVPETAFDPGAGYVHITVNNTIFGTRYSELPPTGNVPLVADMSSNILSQAYDVKKFGIIYAGAQKNIGPAGVTVVIIRKDLAGNAIENTPAMMDYAVHADKKSMFNTPPTYGIYIAKLVFEWLEQAGGIAEIEKINRSKAAIMYEFLDNSDFFRPPVAAGSRSIMNITFLLKNDKLNENFLKNAQANGLVNLKGHRSVGGMRASIYNAMPIEGVKKLVDFMKKFEVENK